MRKWFALSVVLMACVLSLVIATQAFAATVVIDNPNPAYLAETTKLDFSSLVDGDVTSVSDAALTATFSQPIRKGTSTPMWTWGNPGEVEQDYPAFLFSYDGPSNTIQLSRPVREFGFEACTNLVDVSGDISVTFVISSGGTVVDTVTRTLTVNGSTMNRSARLFAIKSDVAFDRVEIVTTDNNFLFAQLRYALPPATSTPASSDWSLALLAVGVLGVAYVTRKRLLAA
jgi:hypothetical protein